MLCGICDQPLDILLGTRPVATPNEHSGAVHQGNTESPGIIKPLCFFDGIVRDFCGLLGESNEPKRPGAHDERNDATIVAETADTSPFPCKRPPHGRFTLSASLYLVPEQMIGG